MVNLFWVKITILAATISMYIVGSWCLQTICLKILPTHPQLLEFLNSICVFILDSPPTFAFWGVMWCLSHTYVVDDTYV